jgi:hypothetical protein
MQFGYTLILQGLHLKRSQVTASTLACGRGEQASWTQRERGAFALSRPVQQSVLTGL